MQTKMRSHWAVRIHDAEGHWNCKYTLLFGQQNLYARFWVSACVSNVVGQLPCRIRLNSQTQKQWQRRRKPDPVLLLEDVGFSFEEDSMRKNRSSFTTYIFSGTATPTITITSITTSLPSNKLWHSPIRITVNICFIRGMTGNFNLKPAATFAKNIASNIFICQAIGATARLISYFIVSFMVSIKSEVP